MATNDIFRRSIEILWTAAYIFNKGVGFSPAFFSPYFSCLERERPGPWKSDAQGRIILLVNPKHLETLKKGVEAWNKWRKNNPDIKPDLREANLLRANLSEADLSGANLWRANLWRANLSGANLWRAALNEAYLWRADLSGANLHEADLSGVNLEGAENLTLEQLSKVRTLYKATLDPELEKQIKKKYPHLLEFLKKEKKEQK